jgi:hypothetical protein
MEDNKYRKFYLDWWSIRKSTIYMICAVIFFAIATAAGAWWVTHRDWDSVADQDGGSRDAAHIISFEGDVRITRAATRETIIVTKQTYVAAGDTIQTQSDGRAVVQMIDGSVYTVKANSTVVVRDSSSLFGGKNVRVSLDDGQLNVRTDQQPNGAQNVVEVAESENKLLSDTDASFNADAQTSGGEIRVSRGGVETTVGGQKTTLTDNEFATVNNGNIVSREKLLEPPEQISPGNSAQIVDSSGAGVNVAFSWEDVGMPASSYTLQVAKSPYFGGDTVLVDRSNVAGHEFRMGGLVPGTYYWRLKATARSGQTTNWNDPWKFAIVRGDGGQQMEAGDWHVDMIGGNVYLISGRTRPGSIVRSQGREVFAASDGSFRIQISTSSSVTAIEIGDERGNRSGFVLSLRNGTVARKY